VPQSESVWRPYLRMMPYYVAAILAVAAAFVVELLLNHFLQSVPFVTVFLCAILLAAWLGGAGPGLLATTLSALVLVFYFIPSLDTPVGARQEIARIVLFAVASLFAVWVCVAQRRTAQSLLGARAELEATVEKLEKLNEGQRQTEARLSEAERELRLTLDSTPAIIWRGGSNGYVQQLNKRWFDYTGTTYEQVRGRRWKSCVHPDDLEHLVDAGGKYVASGIPVDSEARLRRFDGEYRWFLFRPVPARDETGRIVAWYGAVLDIEDRKRAEQKAVEAERQAEETRRDAQDKLAHANRVATIGQLTASITHEVNQPITAARTNASAALNFLERSQPDLEEVKEALEHVVKDVDRAGAVVARMRALMRRSPMQMDSMDMNEAVREVIELTRSEALKNKVALQTELTDRLPIIRGDRIQLQQVVLNLILNAVQAMDAIPDKAREVCITTGESLPGEVRLGVRDTGPGLTPDGFSRLFEPFYTTKPSGMGMGLAICQSIVEAHGGRLWATANKPRGAMFQFSIPVGKDS
jgi:PAS domain S-box-containing protein